MHHAGPSSSAQALIGLEIEMVTACTRGFSLPVRKYFAALGAIKSRRGIQHKPIFAGGRTIGISTATATCGLDNGFNLLETALAPCPASQAGWDLLAARAHQELADSITALESDGGLILNCSQHPACARDQAWYKKTCVPRPIYRELVDHRGWHHWEGIDAKAQNGANTSVKVHDAIPALNAAMAMAPVSIALFGNSPFESGQVTGLKETRMTLWERMFGPARFQGDLALSVWPENPFRNMQHFFTWMHGPGTVSRGLPIAHSSDYKDTATVLLDGNPCLLEFLQADSWSGLGTETRQKHCLTPDAHHFEYAQIGQFLDARLRFQWRTQPELGSLLRAWHKPDGLELLFEDCQASTYIEGRTAGAGFADMVVLREGGPDIARSMLLSPIALQAGLLNRLAETRRLWQRWGWQRLAGLRKNAIAKGLEDAQVRKLCQEALEIAADGMPGQQGHWLDYARFVLQTGRSNADRLLETWNGAGPTPSEKMARITSLHTALHPAKYGAQVQTISGRCDPEPQMDATR